MLPETEDIVRVYEPETSRLLAMGHGARGGDHEPIRFHCETGAGMLLAYYFGKGRRQVVIQSGPNEGLPAHMKTRWSNGQREWTFDW